MKSKLIMTALLLICVTPIFALTQDTEGFDAVQLIALLNPVIVFLAIQGAKLVGKINSTVILAVLIPGLSLLGSYLIGLVVPELNFWAAAGFGFIATFIRELQKALAT